MQQTLTEYGQQIDPMAMVEPPDATELELEADHPGINDLGYIAAGRSNSPFAAVTGSNGSARRSLTITPRKPASGAKSAPNWRSCTRSMPTRNISWPRNG